MGGVGRLQPCRGDGDGGGDLRQQAFGLAARRRLLVGRHLGRVLCTLAAVECVVQREPIIAVGHCSARAVERINRGLVLVGGVLLGTGGASRVDGALRLVQFLLGRVAAGGQDEHGGENGDEPGTDGERHAAEYIRETRGVMDDLTLPRDLVDVARRASRVVVLTGAGMSAESGIPTFRGNGGLWRTFRPEALATPSAFARDPATVWAWYRWRQRLIAAAAPNDGHLALARMAAARPGWRVVTQNVDGLHQRAGSQDVLELHGSIWRLTCSRPCGRAALADPARVPPEDAPLPICACGALQRPGVVWFGEALDAAVLDRAFALSESADLCLVVGTSALVYPAAALPEQAHEGGACIVEINPQASPLSARARHVIRGTAVAALTSLERAL
jgi:NAD-dependent deacetylase